MNESDTKTYAKKKRPTSTRYPYYSLEEMLDFTKKIGEIAGKGFADIKSIMSIFNTDTVYNNAMSYSISSSEYFGLTEKSKEGVRLTPLGREIIYPTEDDKDQHDENLKKALMSPKLYQKIIQRYEGSILPSDEILENVFNSMGIIRTKVKRAVKIFIESAIFGKILDSNRQLNLRKVKLEGTEEEKPEEQVSSEEFKEDMVIPEKDQSSKKKPIGSDYFELDIPLGSGKNAYINIPMDATINQIDQIRKMIDVIQTMIEFQRKSNLDE